MKNFIIALLLGVVVGGGIVWYANDRKTEAPRSPVKSQVQQDVDAIKKSASGTADSWRDTIDAKLDVLHLKANEIKGELAAKGKIVRTQAAQFAETVKDATRDARITTQIKGKFALDKDVSSLDISVNTTDGVVTLAGTAPSYDSISRAILLAMETEGVRQVVSTIQVK